MTSHPLPGIFFLAPMAEITTPALRSIVKEFSPDVVLYSEMLSAGAIVAGAGHNAALTKKFDFDEPFIYQILGNSPAIMAEACAILTETGCSSIDINMGCAAPEILNKGQGARLLTDYQGASEIIRRCRNAVKTGLSVKMRTGFDHYDREEFLRFAKMLESEGVDFIAVHPRYAKLGFKRKADWEFIRLAVKNLSIPVIGNGDVTLPEEAVKKMATYGCPGLMIGREAVKSPWIFRLCNDILQNSNNILEINLEKIFIMTLERIQQYLPENLHKSRGHRFCFYFSRNVLFGHKLFTSIRRHSRINDMIIDVKAYFERHPEEKIHCYYKGARLHETD